MTIPRNEDIEIPLLTVLEKMGGESAPRNIYSAVAAYFPEMTKEEFEQRLAASPQQHVFSNRVQWARNALVTRGEIDGGTRGVWRITQRGRERLRNPDLYETNRQSRSIASVLVDILDNYQKEYQRDPKSNNPYFRGIIADLKVSFSPLLSEFELGIKCLGGKGNARRNPYITFLAPGHKTSKGLYPAFMFDLTEKSLRLYLGFSDDNLPSLNLITKITEATCLALRHWTEKSQYGSPAKVYFRNDLKDATLQNDLREIFQVYNQVLDEFDLEIREAFKDEEECEVGVAEAEQHFAISSVQINQIIDAFLKWFEGSSHKNKEHIQEYSQLSKEYFENLTDAELSEFFFQFAKDGGFIQSGGERTASQLRSVIDNDPGHFRQKVLAVFNSDFNLKDWWDDVDEISFFGRGVRSIFLHRLFPHKYTVFNKKSLEAYKMLSLIEGSLRGKFIYEEMNRGGRKLVSFRPKELTLYRADALTHFLLGTEDGQSVWNEILADTLVEDEGNLDDLSTRTITNLTSSETSIGEANTEYLANSSLSRRYTLEDAMDELFMAEEMFDKIFKALVTKKNIILQGPPGTGKTFIARRLAYRLFQERDSKRVRMVQFHQSYSYEDFIQGYRPREDGQFHRTDGVFYSFCKEAALQPSVPFVFIIDEINRGNLSKIFGELLLLVESDKRSPEYAVQLAYAREGEGSFYIPPNIHIIGTMNTADRSLAMVDYALRRRFRFLDIRPQFDSPKFRDHLIHLGVQKPFAEKLISLVMRANEEIRKDTVDLGSGYEIGHSYFSPTTGAGLFGEDWYEGIIEQEIVPLLSEYWFDNPEKVEELTRILAI